MHAPRETGATLSNADSAAATAIASFSRWRGEHLAAGGLYRDLIPPARPAAGEQYAFEVDLDACSGCKACAAACHSQNGLEEGELWRQVGLLHGTASELPARIHVTAACHHCAEPGCLSGCPVKAYEKDGRTGIVRHLDDQCIGCRYCQLTCPYDVPQYSEAKGIVRKCDMCRERLEAGEAPACAAACPNGAIRIRTVPLADIARRGREGEFLPGAPHPSRTLPATSYLSRRRLAVEAADSRRVAAGEAHASLALFLVLAQLACGMSLADLAAAAPAGRAPFRLAALAVLAAALAASLLHLGRPLYAFRAWIGFRTSWLSREVLAFALFALLAGCSAGAGLLQPAGDWTGLRAATAAAGAGVLFASAMVYAVTGRPTWRFPLVAGRFCLSTALLGTAALLAWEASGGPASPLAALRGATAAPWFACLVLLKVAFEAAPLLAKSAPEAALQRLLLGKLRGLVALRLAMALLSLLAFSAAVVAGIPRLAAAAGLLAAAAGEWLERLLFFRTAAAPRMPGEIPS
jgi:formate dehydrogenase iron-sulfur subunit